MIQTPVPAVHDPGRLAAVSATGLLDTGAEDDFDRLTKLAAMLLDVPLAFVTLVDDRRQFWKSVAGAEAIGLPMRETPVEESFCQYVVGSREPLFVDDAEQHPVTRDNPSVATMNVKAWAGYPVHSPDGHVLGTLCVVDHRPRAWSERDVEVLRTLSHAASGQIALLDAVETARREARRAGALAQTLQESLLAPVLPRVPGLELASRYRPAGTGSELVGDFFDVFQGIGDVWHVVIGDVCGKGVEAAKITALARYTLRAAAMHDSSPGAMLSELNDGLLLQRPSGGLYLTALVATVRATDAGVDVSLALAGHPPALLRRGTDGRVQEAGAAGSMLGYFPVLSVTDAALTLTPGDVLLLYTDGVTDVRRGAERFGEGRLRRVVADADRPSAAALASELDAALEAFVDGPLDDDVALLVLRVRDDSGRWDRT